MCRIAFLGLLASLVITATAGATEPAAIRTALNPDGSGQMIANSTTNPSGEAWSWLACAPDGMACSAFATGRVVNTTGASAATLFKALASDGPSATSPVWRGNVAPAAPPRVTGQVRVNALVTPHPGTWTGGWEHDKDLLGLDACAHADGTACTSLTNLHYVGGCPGGAAVVDPVFRGWYLRVIDQRQGVDVLFTAVAVGSPYGPDRVSAGPTTAVAIVGRIAAAQGPRASSCGPPALPIGADPHSPGAGHPCASGRSPRGCIAPAVGSLNSRGVATIHCAATICSVLLRARLGPRSTSLARIVRAGSTVSMQIPAPARKRLGRGRAAVTVQVNGDRIAIRTIKLA